jgi:hypothetical protein
MCFSNYTYYWLNDEYSMHKSVKKKLKYSQNADLKYFWYIKTLNM